MEKLPEREGGRAAAPGKPRRVEGKGAVVERVLEFELLLDRVDAVVVADGQAPEKWSQPEEHTEGQDDEKGRGGGDTSRRTQGGQSLAIPG